MRRIILLFFIFIILASCNLSTHTPQPKRSPEIPKTAFWIGGLDGGNWYDVKSIHSHRNNAYISIYNDETNKLIVSKKFILICQKDNVEFIKDLREEIISFDGNRINLKSGCFLQ